MLASGVGLRDNKTGYAALYIPEYHTLLRTTIPQSEIVKNYKDVEIGRILDTHDPKILKDYYEYKERESLFSPPTLGFALLTNMCNMECDFCYAQKNTDTSNSKFDPAWVDYLTTILPKSSFEKIYFSGGEPLLEFEAMKRIRPHFKDGVIYTNGSLLNDEIVEWLIETTTKLYVALDFTIEGFCGHDGAVTRAILDRLVAKYPKFKDLIDIAITYPTDKVGEVEKYRREQQCEFESTVRHDFNYIKQSKLPTSEEFEQEVKRVESGETRFEESLFIKATRYITLMMNDYINYESCKPSININYLGDLTTCQVSGSNTERVNYQRDILCNVYDFNLEHYYEKVAHRLKGPCKLDCPCRYFCGQVCWIGIEHSRFQCAINRKALFYALYLFLNYSNAIMYNLINIQRIHKTEMRLIY